MPPIPAVTTSEIVVRRLACGMPLLVEPIDTVQSAAVSWLLPMGSARETDEQDGYGALLSELMFRGAGDLDSRQFSDALDRLGVRRSTSANTHHLRLGATMLGRNVDDALPLLTDMVCRPRLPADALDAVRMVCLQELESLDDDPQDLVMLRLRERHLPQPYGRTGYGRREVLENASLDDLKAHWARHCVPGGAIFAAAGAVDPDRLAAQLDELLDGWTGEAPPPPEPREAQRDLLHLKQDTAQVHLGLAWNAPREGDPDAAIERLAIAVLSGGTSGRLFSEVRQKRALCYSVGASYRGGKDWGTVTAYAGTTPQRAQETLDVCIAEIDRLRRGAEAHEYNRAVMGLKSRLVMQGESTSARAAALAADFFRLGRTRTLEERTAEIDAVTLDALNAYLAQRTMRPITIAMIGPEPLTPPEG